MRLSAAALFSALLVGLVAGAPTDHEARLQPRQAATPSPPLIATPAPSASITASRNKCSVAECPKLCSLGGDNNKRSIEEAVDEDTLTKRFLNNQNLDQFPYELLDQSYTRNVCPASAANSYIFKNLATQRNPYAAALQGLSGCTTLFVASGSGVFSSHMWELDESNNPPRDLQPANYQATLTDLSNNLSPNKASFTGGQAFLIIPVDPDNPANYLYGDTIVNAIQAAVLSASGIMPVITTYVPLDFEMSEVLGTNKAGTASFEFDPAYTDTTGTTSRAYRVYAEGVLLALETGL